MAKSSMAHAASIRCPEAATRVGGLVPGLARLFKGMLVLWFVVCPTFSWAADSKEGSSEQELTSLATRWWESIKKHDRAMLESVLADDFMGVDNGGTPATTKSQWVAWAMGFQLKSYVIERLEMRIAGDTAIVAVHYSTRAIVGGVEKDDHGVDMDVYVRRNGRWQALGTGEIRVITNN